MSRGTHRAPPIGDSMLPRRPFTVLDELSCYFDTPHEPANVHLEVRVPGRLEQGAFREATIAALTANTRARGRRAPGGPLSRSYRWEYPDRLDVDPVSFTRFADVSELARGRAAFIARSPSLDTSPPVLLLLASGPDCDHVILNAHHAAMDGMSCVELFRDIGRRYRALAGAPSPVAAAGTQPLASAPGATVPSPGGPPAGSLPGAALPGTAPTAAPPPGLPPGTGPPGNPAAAPRRTRRSRPARVAGNGGGQRGCGLQMWLLPRVPVLRAADSVETATLNDAMITALIATVGRWNAEHGRPARRVRITVPINARNAGQQRALGNHSRLVTIAGIPPPPDADLALLLHDVAAQVRDAREQPGPQVGAGSRGIAALWCPAAVKRWLVRAALRTAGPLVCDTVMLTNLGKVADPPDFGQQGAVTMALSGPAQMPRGISLAAVTAGGQPLLALRYNRVLLDETAAARLLASYVQTLGELTCPPGPGGEARDVLTPDWSRPASAVTLPAR